jgi:hypothetical protein
MVVDFARSVLGLDKANSTEFDLDTPYPVIDLMDEQTDVTDMGGTMRLGAYVAMLRRARRSRALRRETSPSATATATRSTTATASARRGRPRAARGPRPTTGSSSSSSCREPLLGRHPGPPGVQEPARPAAPAVSGARRRGTRACTRLAIRTCSRSSPMPMTELGTFFNSPGFTDEETACFLAEDLTVVEQSCKASKNSTWRSKRLLSPTCGSLIRLGVLERREDDHSRCRSRNSI